MTKTVKALLAASLLAVGVAGVSLPAAAYEGYCVRVEAGGQVMFAVYPVGGIAYLSDTCPPGFEIFDEPPGA